MSDSQRPPHPGETLRDHILPELGLSIDAAARQLGVSTAALSSVVEGRAGITPELAPRIELWLGNTARIWLDEQSTFDLWQARQAGVPGVQTADDSASDNVHDDSGHGGWNYRVIEFPATGGETYRAIHEVHYNQGVPTGYSETPAPVSWWPNEDDAAGRLILDRMRAAMRKPVLAFEDFGAASRKKCSP